MKKLLFVFFTLMMVLIFRSYNVSADDNAENLKKVIYTVESNNGVNISPLDTYDMVDISGEKRFFVVTFMCDGNNGFAILDKEEDEVAIYALNSSVEFVHEKPMMLVSLFDYVVIDEENDSAVSLVSGISYVFSDLSKELQERKDIDEQDNEEDNEFLIPDDYIEESSMEMNGTRSNIIVYGGNDTSLVYNAGSNSGSYSTDCGINASAMYLRHMNNYFYYSYVSSAHSTETLLKICLAEISYNLYSATSDLTMSKVAAITSTYIDTYSGTYADEVSSYSYSWANYTYRINGGSGKPCILRVPAGTTGYWTQAHAVLGVGYTYGATDSSGYLIVNSGWTNLGYVQIPTSVPNKMIA